MPAYARTLSLLLGVTLGVFLSVGGWYWLLFKQPAPEHVDRLQQQLPTLVALIDAHHDQEVAEALDALPYRVIIANSDRQAISSNLGAGLRERQEQAQRALNSGLFNEYLTQSGLRFYYQLPVNYWDQHLLFPLLLGLLLGLLAALWDLWQRQQMQEQTDTLIMLSYPPAQPRADTEALARLQNLEAENQALKASAMAAAKRLPAAEDSRSRQELESELLRLQRHQKQQQESLRQQANSLGDLQAELQHQNERVKQRDAELIQAQAELQQAAQVQQKALQQLADLTDKLQQAEDRLSETQSQSHQLHAAWQEIQQLRSLETQWQQKQASWQRDKQHFLGQLQEKESQFQATEIRLQQTRQKLSEVSTAYKKQLETLQHLPPDLQDVQAVLNGLIEEKDLIERENADLRIELADRASESHRLRKELEVRAERLLHAQQRLDNLDQELQKNEQELGLLNHTLANQQQDFERVQELYETEQQVLSETRQERDQLSLQLDEQAELNQQLNQELQTLQHAHQALRAEVEALEIEQLIRERDQLRQSLQLMTQQQERRQLTIETLKGKLRDGEALYERLKQHTEKQARRLQEQMQEIQRYRSELHLLEGRGESLSFGNET